MADDWDEFLDEVDHPSQDGLKIEIDSNPASSTTGAPTLEPSLECIDQHMLEAACVEILKEIKHESLAAACEKEGIPLYSLRSKPTTETSNTSGEGKQSLYIRVNDAEGIYGDASDLLRIAKLRASRKQVSVGSVRNRQRDADKSELQYSFERQALFCAEVQAQNLPSPQDLAFVVVELAAQQDTLLAAVKWLEDEGHRAQVASCASAICRSPGLRRLGLMLAAEALEDVTADDPPADDPSADDETRTRALEWRQRAANRPRESALHCQLKSRFTAYAVLDARAPPAAKLARIMLLAIGQPDNVLLDALDGVLGKAPAASADSMASSAVKGEAWTETRKLMRSSNAYEAPIGLDKSTRRDRHISLAAYTSGPYASEKDSLWKERRQAYQLHGDGWIDASAMPHAALWRTAQLFSCADLAIAIIDASKALSLKPARSRREVTENKDGSSSLQPVSAVLTSLLLSLVDMPPLVYMLQDKSIWEGGAASGYMGEVALTRQSLADTLSRPRCGGLNTLWFIAYHYYSRWLYREDRLSGYRLGITYKALAKAGTGASGLVEAASDLQPDQKDPEDSNFHPRVLATCTARRLADPLHIVALQHDSWEAMWPQLLIQSHGDGWLPARLEDALESPYHPNNRLLVGVTDQGWSKYIWPGGWRTSTTSFDVDSDWQWVFAEDPATFIYTKRRQQCEYGRDMLQVMISMPGSTQLWCDASKLHREIIHPAYTVSRPAVYHYGVPYAVYEEFTSGLGRAAEEDGVVTLTSEERRRVSDGSAKRPYLQNAEKHGVTVPDDPKPVTLFVPSSIMPYDGGSTAKARYEHSAPAQAIHDSCWIQWWFATTLFDAQLAAGRQAGDILADNELVLSNPSDEHASFVVGGPQSPTTKVPIDRTFPSEFATASGDPIGSDSIRDILSLSSIGAWRGATAVRRTSAAGRAGKGNTIEVRAGDIILHQPGEAVFQIELLVASIRVMEDEAGQTSVILECIRREPQAELFTLTGPDRIRYSGMDSSVPLVMGNQINPAFDVVEGEEEEAEGMRIRLTAALKQLRQYEQRLQALRWAWMGANVNQQGQGVGLFATVNASQRELVPLIVEKDFLQRLMQESASEAAERSTWSDRLEWLTRVGVPSPDSYHREGWNHAIGSAASSSSMIREDDVVNNMRSARLAEGQHSSSTLFDSFPCPVPRRFDLKGLRDQLISSGIDDAMHVRPMDAASGDAAPIKQRNLVGRAFKTLSRAFHPDAFDSPTRETDASSRKCTEARRRHRPSNEDMADAGVIVSPGCSTVPLSRSEAADMHFTADDSLLHMQQGGASNSGTPDGSSNAPIDLTLSPESGLLAGHKRAARKGTAGEGEGAHTEPRVGKRPRQG